MFYCEICQPKKEFSTKQGLNCHLSKYHPHACGMTSKTYSQFAQNEYYINPKICIECNNTISYRTRVNKFCSRACSARYNNKLRIVFRHKKESNTYCIQCNKQIRRGLKYCSNKCQNDWQWDNVIVQDIISGKRLNRSTLRKYLIRTHGYKCMGCNLDEWRGSPLPLELDHIDGDASNHKFDNLRLLCSNCHSITPFWKGRNKGNGRKSRGIKMHY